MRYTKSISRREQGVVCITFFLSVIITAQILSSMENVQEHSIDTDAVKDVPEPDDSKFDARGIMLNNVGQGHQGYGRSLMEKGEVKHDTYYAASETDLIGAEDQTVAEEEVKVVYGPWENMNNSREKLKHCLSIRPSGRLGNKLFAYAALISIAKKNFMWPCFPKEDELWSIFQLKPRNEICDESKTLIQYVETSPYIYQEDTRRLNYSLDIELIGYFHSWKYFEDVKPIIKEHFTFKESVMTAAKQFLHLVLDKMQRSSVGKKVVPIGIHIRLGDMQHYYNVEKGYTVVSLEYIDTAMTYFLSIYGPRGLVFIVCSDNIQYVRETLTGLKLTSQVPTFYADDMAFLLELAEYSPVPHLTKASVQLCLLSLCEHNIISTGSFSWWSGWLSNGTVIYYKNFPAPYSELESQFESHDYFPARWIGFDM